MCSKMRLGLQTRCQAEAIAQGFHPDLGLAVMSQYLDEKMLGEELSDDEWNNRFITLALRYSPIRQSLSIANDNLHQVYTEINCAVTNYLKYVKNTSEEELLAS
jgi:hypothetical protein